MLGPMAESQAEDAVRRLVAASIAEKNLSMAGISRGLGKSHAYIQQYLEKKSPRWLPEDVRPMLAQLLGLEEAQLRRPGAPPASPRPLSPIPLPSPHQPGQGRDLPVLGMAECGPDGWSLWNGEIIEMVSRPANLAGVPKAYAVYVVGHSMEPRFQSGEIVHVHPFKPVNAGAYVLVQLKPDQPGEAPKAVLKRLVRESAAKLVLEQFSPAKKFDIAKADIVSVHRVVGLSEA